jgi:hypothetical protein
LQIIFPLALDRTTPRQWNASNRAPWSDESALFKASFSVSANRT